MSSWAFPLSLTIERVSLNGADEYGNPSAYVASTISTVGDLQPVQQSEDTVLTDRQTEEWKCFLPAGTVIDGNDRVIYAGQTFEVVGPPFPRDYPSPLSYVLARVRRVT
jgi:hypothetical protein